MIEYPHKRALARQFAATGAYLLAPTDGPRFKLRSGKESDFYINCRKVALSTLGARLIATGLVPDIKRVLIDVHEKDPCEAANVVVTGAGGQALIGALLFHAPDLGLRLNGSIDRGEAKAHGTQERLEGILDLSLPTILVDDTLTTGSTMLALAAYLEGARGVYPAAVLYVVDREEGGKQVLKDHGYKVNCMITASELRELAPRVSAPALTMEA